MGKPEIYRYRIDADDVIIAVDDAFVTFARENDAPELTRENSIGHSIWSFVEGPSVTGTYRALFDQARVTHSEIAVPFRCDSPDMIRQMELKLRPMERGILEVHSELLFAIPRKAVVLFSRHAQRSRRVLMICSICRHVSLGGEWLEAEYATWRYRLLDGLEHPRLSETICPVCIKSMH